MQVSTASTLVITFSEAMNTSNVNYVSLPTIAFGAPMWSNGNTVLTLVPSSALSFAQNYVVSVSGQDVAGNGITPPYQYSFRTEAMADTQAPSITSTLPADNSMAIPTTTELGVRFSEPMRTGSVQLMVSPSITLGTVQWTDNDSELAVSPTSPFTANQMYTVTVTGADVAGNALPSTTFGFMTAAPPDTTPPTLASSTPANNATSVAAATHLSLTFSEGMNTGAITVTPDPDPGLGTPTWSNSDRTVTFATPMSDWEPAKAHTVQITGSDKAGNALAATSIAFTTAAPPDTTRPEVTSTAPDNMSTGVPYTTNLEFNFSEPMDQMVTQMAFSSTPPVNCSFTWNTARTLMVCNPNSDLTPNADYALVVSTLARDDAGNTLMTDKTVVFHTAAAPDTTRPTVTSTTPASGAVGVPRTVLNVFTLQNSPISVAFSEPMSQAAAQAAFSITSPSGYNGGTFSWNRNTMTYVPPSAFPYGQVVTFQISTVAADLAGNTLMNPVTSSFRIRRRTTVSALNVAGSASLDGYIYASSTCSTATVVTGSTVAAAGDRYTTGTNPTQNTYRGYLTFSLAALNSYANVSIASATLYAQQVACYGSVYTSTFGSTLEAWHVDYGPSLDVGDCSTANLGNRQYTLSTDADVELKTVSVTPAVSDDYTNRATRGSRSQFMIRPATLVSDGDMTSDYCNIASFNTSTAANRPYLSITFDYD